MSLPVWRSMPWHRGSCISCGAAVLVLVQHGRPPRVPGGERCAALPPGGYRTQARCRCVPAALALSGNHATLLAYCSHMHPTRAAASVQAGRPAGRSDVPTATTDEGHGANPRPRASLEAHAACVHQALPRAHAAPPARGPRHRNWEPAKACAAWRPHPRAHAHRHRSSSSPHPAGPRRDQSAGVRACVGEHE